MLNLRIKIFGFMALICFLFYIMNPSDYVMTAYAKNDGNDSTIAGINVSGLKHQEIQSTLQDAINTWISEPITISGGGEVLEIDPSTFQYDVESTITQYEKLTHKPWYAFWKKTKIVHIPLQLTVPEEVKNEIDLVGEWISDETYNSMVTNASNLKEHEIAAVVQDFSKFENERLGLSIEAIPENVLGLSELVDELNDTLVNPNEEFSFLESTGNISELANGSALNFVASMIYDVALQAGYEITERYPQKEIPTYLEAGKEASINIAFNEDLKFKNTSKGVGLLKATIDKDSLKLEIYSELKEKDVYLSIDKNSISPRIINRYSNDLAIGEIKLLQEGVPGLRVNVLRTINENGNVIEETISRDYYAPINRIVLKSSRSLETTNTNSNTDSSVGDNELSETESDSDLNVDIDGDGLPDMKVDKPLDEDELPPGSYYDKGGNLVTP